MNLTPLQERRLRQIEDQIAFFEKQVQAKGAWYVIRSALFFSMLFYVTDFFFYLLIEKKSLAHYIADYSWLKLLFNWIAWIGIQYLFVVKGNRSQLKHKKKELQELKKRYGLMEDAV